MSAHPPPVPPEQQPKHGKDPARADVGSASKPGSPGNTGEQGDTANVKQNTTNKGVQQDR